MSRQTFWQRFVAVVGVVLLMAVVGSKSPDVLADPKGYVFTPLAFLGTPTPGGDTFTNDFESSFINSRGDVLFGADVTADEEEGIFLLRNGRMLQIARAGERTPDGGFYGPGILSPITLNDKGDAGFVFLLAPFSFPEGGPLGVNAGVYRFSQSTHTVTPVVIPEVTEVPGGGVFKGAGFGATLNNRGDLVFSGIVQTDQGIHLPDEAYIGLGVGLFKANKKGYIASVVNPGDPAPGGDDDVFDWTGGPWMNDGGDVAFMGHTAGEPCRAEDFPPQAIVIQCLSSVYVREAATGDIRSIAHAGDDAPGGGVYRRASSPVLNNRGDVVFLGDLTPPPFASQVTGVYLHSRGVTIPVARPGDPMPGGGIFVTASNITGWQIHVNNPGDVVFNATLDTVNADGVPDTGLYVWSHGSLRLVARTGTVIPGVGTVDRLVMKVVVIPPRPFFVPNSGATNNDRGQVVFGATLSDERGVLLLATPK
jgi:hypothetical protein